MRAYIFDFEDKPRYGPDCITKMLEIGIEATIFPAVNGSALDGSGAIVVHPYRFAARYGRPPVAGEIGCFATHMKFCRAIGSGRVEPVLPEYPEWFLVFEDDAIPVGGIDAALITKAVERSHRCGLEYIFMHAGPRGRRALLPYGIGSQSSSEHYTHAALIHMSAALRITKWEMYDPIDKAIAHSNALKKGALNGPATFSQRPRDAAYPAIFHERQKAEQERMQEKGGLQPQPGPSLTNTTLEVHTIRYGDPDWLPEFKASLESWCERHSLPLTVWGESEEPLPSQKFRIVEAVKSFVERNEHTHMIYLDADAYIHPDAPLPELLAGFAAMHDKEHTKWRRKWTAWCEKHFGRIPDRTYLYRNAGVFITDREAAIKFLEVAKPPFVEGLMDQHQFNLWLHDAIAKRMNFRDLHPTWNRGPRSVRCAWIVHPWGPHEKLTKLERFKAAGVLGEELKRKAKPRGRKLLVIECVRNGPGLGNRITNLCAGFAAAKIRDMDVILAWRASNLCGAEWEDLFLPLEGIEIIDGGIPCDVRYDIGYYCGNAGARHQRIAGIPIDSPDYLAAWREAAAMIRLQPALELPDVEGFDAISARTTTPPNYFKWEWVDQLPDLSRPLITADSVDSQRRLLERYPDGWTLNPPLNRRDLDRRGLDHTQGAARDMFMLAKARRIIAMGRESTFRNYAHIGMGVPVLQLYHGLSP